MPDVWARGEVVSGTVFAGHPDDAPVDGGDLRAVAWFESEPDKQFWRDGVVHPDEVHIEA
jgi:hypothetical protein